MEVRLSEAEKVFIIHGAQEGLRADGRGPLDYRPVIVQTGVLATTNGSARVQLASTDLLIGVKAELVTVENMETYRNRINFFVDCSANATPLFAGRGGEEFADELRVALDSAYDNGYVLPDLKKLILSPMHVWKLYVDIVLLQCGGNVIDAAGLGVKAALKDTEISEVIVRPADEGKYTVDLPDDNTVWKLNTSKLPLFVSVNRLGSAKIVDNSLAEEACTCASIWIAAAPKCTDGSTHGVNNDDCIITFLKQCGGGALEMDSLEEMIIVGLKMVRKLHEALLRRLAEENSAVENPLSTFLR